MAKKGLWAALGPGLIWAGTAVGVSHLVQSTRAGAGYGLTLWWVVALALITKYPGFEAAQRYTAATGTSLLEGYRRQGTWTLWVFLAQTLVTMCIVEAAVTIVTAGMASALISDALSPVTWSVILLTVCTGVLAIGRYQLLDTVMKVLMVVLSISTLLAVLALVPNLTSEQVALTPPLPELTPLHVGFLAALIGWMPAPLDTAVWHSMWTVEAARSDDGVVDPDEARLDFHVGYFGASFLAVCFLVLGAGTIYGTGQEVPASAAAFAALLVDVYAQALGEWARPLILVTAFTTMVSTTLAVTDGFPRSLAWAWRRMGSAETMGEAEDPRVYWSSLLVVVLGGLAIIQFFVGNLKSLVDLATTVSFVLAPVLAVFNYRAVTAPEVPETARPGPALLWGHRVSIAAMSSFTLAYLVFRFG